MQGKKVRNKIVKSITPQKNTTNTITRPPRENFLENSEQNKVWAKVTQNKSETKLENNKERHTKKKIRRKNKKKMKKLRILYSNVDGIKDKRNHLETTAQACEIDIVAIAETKMKPPKLHGYDTWKSKERKERTGGGVAICAQQEIGQKITKVCDVTEDDEQDVVWVEINKAKNDKVYMACYYGKQEKDKESEVAKEFEHLSNQISMLKQRGELLLTMDANAKLEINEGKYKQKLSRNGRYLKELMTQHDLIAVSLNSKTGKWTRQPRIDSEKESIIDYILVTPGLEQRITEISVDEAGINRIKGKKETDHNTIIIELDMTIPRERKTIKRWKLNNKEGWKKYNSEFQKEVKNKEPRNYEELQNIISKTLKHTVGEQTITIGGKRIKENETIRQLRETKKAAKKIWEESLKGNREKLTEKYENYFESYNNLQKAIGQNNQNNTKQKLENYRKQGAARSISFWKQKAEAEKEKEAEYDTITEEGKTIQNEEETKQYVANYFENLYQARPSKPEYRNKTTEIENAVKEIEEQMRNLPQIPDFTAKELDEAIKKLKRKKATGPDNLPNEIFIEADQQTKEIYRKHFNKLNETMLIPTIWQEGEIKRLWKGKGTKGKCSNERGITLSSNPGKVYERMVNERVLQKINISDAQAGGKKGSATVDHIVLTKELMKSAKRQNKNVDEALLDVTKAYDKAWLTGIMHVLHKQGLTDNHWTIVKRLNENLTARIQTKYGLTRLIKILDSIRQGGVLSTTMYGATMDEISKNIQNEEIGIPLKDGGKKRGTLLWVDDVILIALEGELQKPLDITYETASAYHIEFGEPKSNSMPIKNNKKKSKKHEYKLGEMQLKETNKYKTLGYVQNSKNNNEEHLKAVKGKTEAAYQNMMALVGNKDFSMIEMEAIWRVHETCIQSIMTYAGEAWDTTEKNYKEINQIHDSIIKRILKTPESTPREALYIETGLLDPEMLIIRNRINMEARISKGNNQTMKEILELTNEDSWIKQNEKLRNNLSITKEDMEKTKPAIKRDVPRSWAVLCYSYMQFHDFY